MTRYLSIFGFVSHILDYTLPNPLLQVGQTCHLPSGQQVIVPSPAGQLAFAYTRLLRIYPSPTKSAQKTGGHNTNYRDVGRPKCDVELGHLGSRKALTFISFKRENT